LRRLLQYQPADAPIAEALRPSTSSSSNTPSLNTVSNPVAFQLLPSAALLSNASNARPASQSIAQLLGEVDKRRKKTNYKKRTSNDDGTGTIICCLFAVNHFIIISFCSTLYGLCCACSYFVIHFIIISLQSPAYIIFFIKSTTGLHL